MNQITVHGKTYKLPETPVWRKGKPPSVGWWPTAVYKVEHNVPRSLRFFDGKTWSSSALASESAYKAGKVILNFWRVSEVKWTDQWWK